MTEELNLPASLERLEINPERVESGKMDERRMRGLNWGPEPECTLQGLSLQAECPKGTCHCNRKRDREVTVKRVTFKRAIVRRSKLNAMVLRSPVLRLKEGSCGGAPQHGSGASGTCGAVSGPSLPPPLPLPEPLPPVASPRLSGEGDTEGCLAGRVEDRGCPSAGAPPSASAASCAVQARASPDDTTIDELASYFDLFVHIPKKMSFMAEMMYT